MGSEGLFWIPDEAVSVDERTDRVVRERIDRDPEHRKGLYDSIVSIGEDSHFGWDDHAGSPGEVIFKAELESGLNFRSSSAVSANGMTVNHVTGPGTAIVSCSAASFDRMAELASDYADNGKNRTRFDDLAGVGPNRGPWKLSKDLAGLPTGSCERVRARVLMVPNLRSGSDGWNNGIRGLISSSGGDVTGSLVTPSGMTYLYTETDVDTLRMLCDCPAVLSITGRATVSVDTWGERPAENHEFSLDPTVDLSSLRPVVVLDTGVDLPEGLSDVVVGHHPAGHGIRIKHGTMVASKLAFGIIGTDPDSYSGMRPRCSIVDYAIFDGNEDECTLANRIRDAVEEMHGVSDTFVLSMNLNRPFSDPDDELSVMLDDLHTQYGVRFFVSMGNHSLWAGRDDLADILNDSDACIASPADSVSATSVGSAVGQTHSDSISGVDDPAPYTRIGPGLAGTMKPDIMGYSGTVLPDGSVPMDPYSAVLCREGVIAQAGTSFSNPDAAGCFMDIRRIIGDSGTLTSLAMMHHLARMPVWSRKDVYVDARYLFGHGIIDGRIVPNPMTESMLIRQSSIRAGTCETITIGLPESVRRLMRDRVIFIKVTCMADPFIDRSKGEDMIRNTVQLELRGGGERNEGAGSRFWDVCKQRIYRPKELDESGWQFVLKGYGKEEMKEEDIPYSLIVSIEDRSETIDISYEIEVYGRYPVLNSVDSHISVNNDATASVGVVN